MNEKNELGFVKMHGLGNDFLVLDMFDASARKLVGSINDLSAFAIRECDRHFGVGADGILLVWPPSSKDNVARMQIINSDGSEAEMCGNGIRCIAKFVLEKGYAGKNQKHLSIETLAGIMSITVINGLYMVDMGEPGLSRKQIPMSEAGHDSGKVVDEPLKLKGGTEVRITAVSMGNPHAVVFVEDVNFDFEPIGREVENHRVFPKRSNVEFVHVLNDHEIDFRVWERGAGETLACGTGSCAAVVASVLNKKTGRKVNVHLKGGDLLVEWAGDNHVYMTGPAESAFSGVIVIKQLSA